MKMKRRFTEGHWSPYSGKAAEYVHKIQDNVDTIHTNRWILNPKYGFAWMEDNRGWVSVMKPKVFRVAGEKRYGYQVYGLSKDGTLRDKSSNWWDTPEEAQENIKQIFNIDIVQESTRGNMKIKWRRIVEAESRNKFVNESEEETEWFDSNGDIKRHFPKDCILDCSRSGSVDDEVDYWVSELNFKVPVDRGLSYLREYGLDDIGPEEVDKYVLWIMCGNIKEEAYEFCRDGSEWEYVDRESYPDEMDNWNDDDWDRFQEEACVCHLGM